MSEAIPVVLARKIAIVEVVAPRGVTNGGSGGAKHDHIQGTPSAVWTVAHNLGFRPSVTCLTTGGGEMKGQVAHLSANTLTITFNLPVAGSAHLV